MKPVLWWIRRDLRLSDNLALHAALESGAPVIPLFVVDPALWIPERVGELRLAFLSDGLRSLDASLRERGSRLHLRRGDPGEVLTQVLERSDAEAIFAEADYSPFARARDERLARALPLRRVHGLTVLPPGTILSAAGQPYRVFTPFARAWRQGLGGSEPKPLPAPQRLPPPPRLRSDPMPRESAPGSESPFVAGESRAQERLAAFTGGPHPSIYRYAQERDRLDVGGTSGLSPYLRFGMLSARQAAEAALRAIAAAPDAAGEDSAQAWLDELIWREFYVHALYHHPHLRESPFRAEWGRIRWINDQRTFEAWRQGVTGYPIVDAAMRQLHATGWIHNRARMIVASFLVKDLLIDWRWGERWFMQRLIDADPAANNGGWQWVAGTGIDAAPYFRVFNPTLQSVKFDPQGHFIRRWLPELARVPDRYIHQPHRMPASLQQELGIPTAATYPPPIVEHRQARERALAAYRAAKDQ